MSVRTLFVRIAISASLVGGALSIAGPAAAQPMCDGKPATITDNDSNDGNPIAGIIMGTNGPDVIVGTDGDDIIDGLGGRDRICGLKGNDLINGDDGNDRLFGGSGGDSINGGIGHDDLFGFAGEDELDGGAGRDLLKGGGHDDKLFGGANDDILKGEGANDLLRGQGGDDSLDGGPADDDCKQGAGQGPIRNCEKADLRIDVRGPASAGAGTTTFTVKVKNLGPRASTYSYELDEDNQEATCDGPQPWERLHSFAELAPGATRTRRYDVTCTVNDAGAWVEVTGDLFTDARDARRANNRDKHRVNLQQ